VCGDASRTSSLKCEAGRSSRIGAAALVRNSNKPSARERVLSVLMPGSNPIPAALSFAHPLVLISKRPHASHPKCTAHEEHSHLRFLDPSERHSVGHYAPQTGTVCRTDRSALHRQCRCGNAIARLCSAVTDVFLRALRRAGRWPLVHQCVREAKRAWHAGTASWAAKKISIPVRIGIEIVNRGPRLWAIRNFRCARSRRYLAVPRHHAPRNVPLPARARIGRRPQSPRRARIPREKFSVAFVANSWRRPLGPPGADRARLKTPQAGGHHQRTRP